MAYIITDTCTKDELCVDACPPKCLKLMSGLNAYGVHPAHYSGEHCTACGICFYACPEPGAITVYRLIVPKAPMLSSEAAHATSL